jgi:DNA-binding IclR family transcriptional regulator
MGNRGSHPVKTTQTTFEIVERLIKREGAGVSEVARAIDTPKSTVHDHLQTLAELGIVISEDGQYRTSMKLVDLGFRTREQIDLYRLASSELERIAEETGESTSLMIDEGGIGVLIGVESGPKVENIYIQNSHPGTRAELNTTAGGKAILSQLNAEQVDQIVDEYGLPAATENSITDREQLLEELETIASCGYAIDREERILGMWGVAMPVSTPDTVGAIGVYGPIGRMTTDRIENELIDILRESVNVIKVNMNYA